MSGDFDDIEILTGQHNRALFAVVKLLVRLVGDERVSGNFIWVIATMRRLLLWMVTG
jgi:hypothetical protein